MKKCFTLILLLTFCLENFAQDIHFSQYHNFPLMINPAYTGNFNGMMRVSGIYRNQWFTVQNNGAFGTYQTMGLSVDGNILKEQFDLDRLNIGLCLYSDHAGGGSLTSQEALASISYRKATDRFGKSSLSLGLQGGMVFKRVFVGDLLFETQAEEFGFNPNLFNGETNIDGRTFMYPDLNVGGMWQHEATDYVAYYISASVYHIAEPRETFLGNDSNFIPRRYNFNTGFDFNINDEIVLSHSMLFMQQASASQLNAGMTFKYFFEEDLMGYALVRYRGWSDAFIFGVGLKKGAWRGTLTYDLTTSNLNIANSGQGGIEFSLEYIYKSEKTSRRRRDQFCPSF
ncbi:MAG: PorP/SprF family type IX secretion system membrane protein [Bacteroidetes bacterium]|nr:PorP/SprF family type IX secretion system membrane protein [Bacteroidota bacterium]